MTNQNDFKGSSEFYDIILGKKNYEKYSSFVVKLLKKYKIKKVLELGCGSGMYLIPLKKNGFDIEGLDISKEMLDITRGKNKTLKLYKKDMSNFKINKKYDSILCLNSSLVLLSNFNLIENTIRTCAKHLNKDGLLILDLPNHKKEIKELDCSQEHKEYKTPKGKIDVIFKNYKKKSKWISEWFGFAKENNKYRIFREYYEELIYSPKKFESLLKKEGFKTLALYGTRNGGEFSKKNSYRRFYVCKKI